MFLRIRKSDIIIFLAVFLVVGILFVVKEAPNIENKDYTVVNDSSLPKVQVATSFPMIADWINAVGKDKVEVKVFASPSDNSLTDWINQIGKNRRGFSQGIFFAMGNGFDDWTKNLSSSSNKKVIVVPLDQFISSSSSIAYPNVFDSKKTISSNQIYYWLSLQDVRQVIQGIGRQLGKFDVGNKEDYINNAYDYSIQLDTLLRSTLDVLKNFHSESVALDGAIWSPLVDSLQVHTVGAFDLSSTSYSADKLGTVFRTDLKKIGAKTIITDNSSDPQSASALLENSSFRVVNIDPWGIDSTDYVGYIRGVISDLIRSL